MGISSIEAKPEIKPKTTLTEKESKPVSKLGVSSNEAKPEIKPKTTVTEKESKPVSQSIDTRESLSSEKDIDYVIVNGLGYVAREDLDEARREYIRSLRGW